MLETNKERLRHDIETLSQFSATPGNGVTRYSLTDEDRRAREYLLNELVRLGLEVSVDFPGNIRARLNGTEPEESIVMTGSHLDSVPNGGAFDGIVGVVGALEALRVIKENGIVTKHPIELIVFAEEEGSRFGVTMLGSKYLVGKFSLEEMDKFVDRSGITLRQAATDFGIDINDPVRVIRPGDVKAMIELHIEQSLVLDKKGIPIGIIEGIAGIRWLQVTLRGTANHAGATPMNLRNDALVGAAEVIHEFDKFVKTHGSPTTVGTVGRIECSPNASNVIPGQVTFTVDIRDIDPSYIDLVTSGLKKIVKRVSERNGLSYLVEEKNYSPPVHLSRKIIDVIEDEAKKIGVPFLKMISGAVHDSCLLSDVTDVGMIFVPSIEGRSHCPEERTDFRDIKLGADLLLHSLLRLAEPVKEV